MSGPYPPCWDCGGDHPGMPCPPQLPRRVFRLAFGDEVLAREVDAPGLVAALQRVPAGEALTVTCRDVPPDR